jgi:hypothetical protein
MTQGELFMAEGQARVLDNNQEWLEETLAALERYSLQQSFDREFGMDDFKKDCLLPEPAHANAWGALFPVAARRKILVATGNFRKSTRKPRHAGMIRLWRRAPIPV